MNSLFQKGMRSWVGWLHCGYGDTWKTSKISSWTSCRTLQIELTTVPAGGQERAIN